MPNLLIKPTGTHGKVHDTTPSSAGWGYVGFALYRLTPGDTVTEQTHDREAIIVMVEGHAHIHAAGTDWGVMGDRMNVFERTPPHCLYVPNGSDWTATATTACTIAVCTAPGHSGHAAKLLGPAGITLTPRGTGAPPVSSTTSRWKASTSPTACW